MPTLTVFAGPNGSGKSSIIRWLAFEGRDNLLDADAIAKRIDPADPRNAAVTAGREAILRARQYLDRRESFAFETTLTGNRALSVIKLALELGFFVRLIYVSVDHPELSVQRVRERVAQGGHDVPESDIRRRYNRSLLNLPKILTLVNQATVYDNSGAEPRKMLEVQDGHILWRALDQPSWVKQAALL